MQLIDLDLDDPRWPAVLPVLQELRPDLDADALAAVQAEGHPQGLRFLAAFVEDGGEGGVEDGGRCVGVAGWRIVATTVSGRTLHVDDLVTSSSVRSTGVGKALLGELERRARAAGCGLLDLDSGVHRHGAHRFYLREHLHISAHHFTKQL